MDPEKERRWHARGPFLVAAGIALLALLFSVFREMGMIETWKLGKTRDQILGENSRLREENARLRKEVERLKTSPEYIEEIARKELGLIRQKENVIVLDRAGANPPDPKVKGRP